MNRAQTGRRSFLKTAAQTLHRSTRRHGARAASLSRAATGAAAGEPAAQTPHPAQAGAQATAHKRAPKAPARPAVKLNVRDHGAAGDGKAKDTLAMQQTIERCSVLGGGEVVVPAGDYPTGALVSRSGVTLRIEQGGTL